MNPKISSQVLGAQVISVRVKEQEIFYLSPLTKEDSPARGGVPVLFPQFAQQGPLAKHGFCRNLPWLCVIDEKSADLHLQKYTLSISPETHLEWPYSAQLELTSVAKNDSFHQEFKIINSGSDYFEWTGGLHPYFVVSHLFETTILGLKGAHYQDRYCPGNLTLESESLIFNEHPCEKLFNLTPTLVLLTGSRKLTLSTTGFTQWMVWNPGHEGAFLSDLPSDDWKSFLCIEPVVASTSMKLAPGEIFIGTLTVRIESLE